MEGLPKRACPTAKIKSEEDGKRQVLFMQNAKYTLSGSTTKDLGDINECKTRSIEGPGLLNVQKVPKNLIKLFYRSLFHYTNMQSSR